MTRRLKVQVRKRHIGDEEVDQVDHTQAAAQDLEGDSAQGLEAVV